MGREKWKDGQVLWSMHVLIVIIISGIVPIPSKWADIMDDLVLGKEGCNENNRVMIIIN